MRSLTLLLIGLLTACEFNSKNNSEESDDIDWNASDETCEEEAIECEDALILDLSLQDEISDGDVVNSNEGEDFVTEIDATAGGYQQASSSPWVYIKFTDDGAEKVEITDEEALESMDWDMSLRRFLIRLNGGSSGPSCVSAAVFFEEEYSSLSSVPENTPFVVDEYYTADCSFINDSSGLPGSPQTAMNSWWEYPGCVATTGYPFVLQLADGSLVKLVVESYYSDGQENCNETGAMGTGSANFQMRWSFL